MESLDARFRAWDEGTSFGSSYCWLEAEIEDHASSLVPRVAPHQESRLCLKHGGFRVSVALTLRSNIIICS